MPEHRMSDARGVLGAYSGVSGGCESRAAQLRNLCGAPKDIRPVNAQSEVHTRANPRPTTTALRGMIEAQDPIARKHTKIA